LANVLPKFSGMTTVPKKM